MSYVFPDYYENFRCIADKCPHNCCIGWEINIDPVTLELYQNTGSDLGERLKNNISLEDTPRFILKEHDRCPFLNCNNLCDIITEKGEDYLCQVCREHPRFFVHLPDRVEAGVGLSCYAAAKLILTNTAPAFLLNAPEEKDETDEIVILRNEGTKILQNRSLNINTRIEKFLEFMKISLPEKAQEEWAEFFLTLEKLNPKWEELINKLLSTYSSIDFKGFDAYMKDRLTEYEQLLVYLVYRHVAKSPDFIEVSLRSAFAVVSYSMIYSLGAMIFTEKGNFTTEDQIELCRLFSSEIEYSDRNVEFTIDYIYNRCEIYWENTCVEDFYDL